MEPDDDVVLRDVGGSIVLELHGNVDRSSAERLTAAYEQGRRSGDGMRVVLDFSRMQYLNSSGIAVVVSILARARGEGLVVAATGLSEHYRHIFDITRLSDFIEVCPDLDAALVVGGQRQ